MLRRGAMVLFAIVFTMQAAGCGSGKGGAGAGSGGGSGNGGGSTGASPTAFYLFYQGSLIAIDPNNPASPIVVESQAISGARTALSGQQDSPTRVSGLSVRSVVYARDGKLWKVSALSSGVPVPVRVSSETLAATLCSSFVGDDLADHDNTAYVYELGGADGNCNTASDNVWKIVRLGMSEFDAPLSAAKPVIDIGSDVSGAVTGWLGTAGGVLYKYDASFAAPAPLIAFSNAVSFIVAISNQRVIIRVDDDLYSYDAASGALSSPLHHYSSAAAGAYQSDGGDLFFTDGGSIYKLPLDGSAPAASLVTQGNVGSDGLTLNLTDAYVIYSWRDSNTLQTTLNRIAKAGGSAQRIFSGIEGVKVVTAADLIYYTAGTSNSLISYVVREDGSAVAQYNGALWWGQSLHATVDVSKKTQANKLFLLEGYNNPSLFFANGTISAYAAATHARTAVLGSIPADVTDIFFNGIGDAVIGAGGSLTSPQTTDIFIANTQVNGSLSRITTTSAVSEQPLW